MTAHSGPVTEGKKWERHRRARHAVLKCPGQHVRDVRARCPYEVIVAQPGDETQEHLAAKAAADHWTDQHGGLMGDVFRKNVDRAGGAIVDSSGGLVLP